MAEAFNEVSARGGSGSPGAIFIDDLHLASAEEIATVFGAWAGAAELGRGVSLVFAALPSIVHVARQVSQYADRIEFVRLDALGLQASYDALCAPFVRNGMTLSDEAAAEVLLHTRGCPYFIQVLGSALWDSALDTPIARKVGADAAKLGIAELDANFFGPEMDRLGPKEQQYLEAMAKLGPGPHRSGAVASALGVAITAAAPIRSSLIAKALLYSSSRGETAFAMPGFDEFVARMAAANA